MATRLYPINHNASPWGASIEAIGYPAGYYGTWNKVQAAGVSSSVVILTDQKYGSGGPTSSTNTDTSATTPYKVAINKFISVPLSGAGTLAGTLQCCIGLLQSNADADFAIAVHAWISVGSTPTRRGTIIDNYTEVLSPTTEWPTTATFAEFIAPITLDPVDYEDGDRIVIEFGFVSTNAFSTSRTGTVRRGAVSAAPPGGTALPDATVGSTNVTTEAGWFEFSQTLTLVPTPSNDLCVNAFAIPTSATPAAPYYDSFVSLERATWSADDPDPSCAAGSRYTTVWYSWTAPSTANFRLEIGTSTDAQGGPNAGISGTITAYTGTCGAFVEVACVNLQNYVTFATTMGVTYHIKVASRFAGGGMIYVIAYPYVRPSNDTCATPTVVAALPYHDETDTTGAVTVPGSPPASITFGIDSDHKAVWYSYTPLVDTQVQVLTALWLDDNSGTRYYTQITIWDATAGCGALVEVANADGWQEPDAAFGAGTIFWQQARAVFTARAGVPYLIVISEGSFSGPLGGFLDLYITDLGTIPTNQDAAGATDIPAIPAFATQDNSGYQELDLPEPPASCMDPDYIDGKFVWFKWTATTTNPMQANTALSNNVISGLAIYSGSPGALVEVACELNNFAVDSAQIFFTPTLGTTYYFRLFLSGRVWGTVNLFLDELRAPLAGDVIVGCGAVWIITPEGAVRDYLFLSGYFASGIPTNGSLDPTLETQLYVSQFAQDQIVHLDVTTQPMTVVAYIPTTPGLFPEGNAFIESGRLITGFRSGAGGEADGLRIYATPSGALETVFPDAEVENDGTGWVDLAHDLRTLIYTSGGRRVMRFDIVGGAQLADFASLPVAGDAIAQGVRWLPDGGALIADYTRVVRLNASGSIIDLFAFPEGEDVHVLDNDPIPLGGTEVLGAWVGLTIGNYLYHLDLVGGTILLQMRLPTFPSGGSYLCGVAVVDGYRAITTVVIPPEPPGPVVGCPARLPLPPATPGCVAIGEL